jgi:hypothetical protein
MAGYLTARQTSEMQAAILDYLASNPEFRESAAAFEREAQLPAESSGRGTIALSDMRALRRV